MNDFICSDCGRALGNDVALSWHRQGVHGADRGMVRPRPARTQRLVSTVNEESEDSSVTSPWTAGAYRQLHGPAVVQMNGNGAGRRRSTKVVTIFGTGFGR